MLLFLSYFEPFTWFCCIIDYSECNTCDNLSLCAELQEVKKVKIETDVLKIVLDIDDGPCDSCLSDFCLATFPVSHRSQIISYSM